MKINACFFAAGIVVSLYGCMGDPLSPTESMRVSPNLATDGLRAVVVVNPNAHGNGVASTVQEGVDMVAEGGEVLLMPGIYEERIMVNKGVTITSIGDGAGQVVLKQSHETAAPATDAVMTIATANPVIVRDLSFVHNNIRAINILRDADVLIEQVAFSGVASTTPVVGNGVTAHYAAGSTGRRAKVIVRDNTFSVGGIAVSFGGDVDGVIERNEVRHAVGRLICVNVNPVGQGGTTLTTPGTETNVEIRDNLFEDCGENVVGRFNSVNVIGSPGATTGGTVNVVGNTFRNGPSGCTASAIQYEHYTGVIERNTIVDVIQSCAPAVATRNFRGAIFIGSRVPGIRAANVAVRFNDIVGNEYAALRIGANQTTAIDATCNWWGSPAGPSSVGSTENRDAIVVAAGAAVPVYTPVATAPIAAGGTCD